MAMEKIKLDGLSWEAEGAEDFVLAEQAALLSFWQTLKNTVLVESAQKFFSTPEPLIPGYKIRRTVESVVDPAGLRKALDENRGREVLHLFDEITIPLDNGRNVIAVCAHVQDDFARFVFKDCYCRHKMNESVTNKGGYYRSTARRYVLEEIYPHFPGAWRDVIRSRKLTENIDGEQRDYTDPLWLPSATDVFGSMPDKWWDDEADSFQLPIFARERDRVKEMDPTQEDYDGTCYWWLRSPYATGTADFCIVYTNGNANTNDACYSFGFAPGFDL